MEGLKQRLKISDGDVRNAQNATKRSSVESAVHWDRHRSAATANHSHVTTLLAGLPITKLFEGRDTLAT